MYFLCVWASQWEKIHQLIKLHQFDFLHSERFCRTWAKWHQVLSQTTVKRISQIHHWSILKKEYGQWCTFTRAASIVHRVKIFDCQWRKMSNSFLTFKLCKNVNKNGCFSLCFSTWKLQMKPYGVLGIDRRVFSSHNWWAWRHVNQPTQQCTAVMQS